MKRRLAEALLQGLATGFQLLADAVHEPRPRKAVRKPGWYSDVEQKR